MLKQHAHTHTHMHVYLKTFLGKLQRVTRWLNWRGNWPFFRTKINNGTGCLCVRCGNNRVDKIYIFCDCFVSLKEAVNACTTNTAGPILVILHTTSVCTTIQHTSHNVCMRMRVCIGRRRMIWHKLTTRQQHAVTPTPFIPETNCANDVTILW